MSDLTYEALEIKSEATTPDLVIWRRYRRPAPGMFEAFLDANPHVHAALSEGPYLPVGTIVRVPIDAEIMSGRPKSQTVVRLYGDA